MIITNSVILVMILFCCKAVHSTHYSSCLELQWFLVLFELSKMFELASVWS